MILFCLCNTYKLDFIVPSDKCCLDQSSGLFLQQESDIHRILGLLISIEIHLDFLKDVVSIESGGEILGFFEDLRGGLGVEEAGRQRIQE